MTRKISRRSFLKTGAALAAGSVLAGCQPGRRRWVVLEPYVRPPEEQLDGVPTYYASTCRACPAGCGIVLRVLNGRAIKIEGNPRHPLNHGKLCPQGQAGLQLLYNPDRLTKPLQTVQPGQAGNYSAVPWESAIGVLGGKLKEAGSGVAVLGSAAMSGHLYDLFGRLTSAVGAPPPVIWDLRSTWNGDSALIAATNQVFGRNTLPAYNVANADVILSFGADFLGAGNSPVRYGVEYGGFRSQPHGLRGSLVHFEPHMSLTAAKADLWVPIRPGHEALAAQAILRIIADEQLGASGMASRAGALAGNVDAKAVADAAGVPIELLAQVARVFAAAAHPVAIPGTALAGGANDVAAVQALNSLATDAVLLSTDPPIPDVKRPVPSSYTDLQRLIEQMRSGAVKVLLIYGANPVYELPEGAGFADALSKVGYVATFSTLMDETAVRSHMVLAERTYLESWGYTDVWPDWGSPMVSSQQPVVPPMGNAQSAGDVLIQLAKQVPQAASAFPWPDEVAYLKELVGKLGPGAAGGSGDDVLWSRWLQYGGWWPAQPAAPAPARATAAGVPTLAQPQFQGDAGQFPFHLYPFVPPVLGVGWGAATPWLQGSSDPLTSIAWQTWVALNPATATRLGVKKGDVVRVNTPNGELEALVYVYPAIREDTVAIPLGQGHTEGGRYAQGRGANVIGLLGSQPGPGGNAPAWLTERCQVTATGATVRVATLEFTPGVEEGFFNKGFPGE